MTTLIVKYKQGGIGKCNFHRVHSSGEMNKIKEYYNRQRQYGYISDVHIFRQDYSNGRTIELTNNNTTDNFVGKY